MARRYPGLGEQEIGALLDDSDDDGLEAPSISSDDDDEPPPRIESITDCTFVDGLLTEMVIQQPSREPSPDNRQAYFLVADSEPPFFTRI